MPDIFTHEPNEAHRKFLQDLKGTLAANLNLSGQEMLAIASQFVGMLVAAQDQRLLTPEMAMQLVSENLQIGNAEAVSSLMASEGQA